MGGFVPIQTFSSALNSTKIHLCTAISIVRRPNFSPCMCMASNYDSYFIVVDRPPSFWTAGDRSYRNHQMKLIIIGPSGPRENQNTIEKNEFYEWGIWRTIMKTMGGNNFICIKINSWPQYYRTPPAFFSTTGFVQTNLLNSWLFSDQVGAPASTSFYHRSHTDQHFNSWPPEINGNSASTPFYHRSIQANIWFFFSWNNPPKTTSYEGFWWFSYRRIFPPIFSFMRLNFEFISFHPLLYSMIGDQFLIIFIDETELLEEVVIDDRVIWKILKNCCI